MPLQYKIDILSALKQNTLSALPWHYSLLPCLFQKYICFHTEDSIIFGGKTQCFFLYWWREKKPISWSNIETICRLLRCQPGDILQFISDSMWKRHSFEYPFLFVMLQHSVQSLVIYRFFSTVHIKITCLFVSI